MDKLSRKYKNFEYFTELMYAWDVTSREKRGLNSLNLTSFLFLTIAATANSEENSLLEIFDNFEAQPYGNIEVDIRENLKNFNRFSFNEGGSIVWANDPVGGYYDEIESDIPKIRASLAKLKELNPDLINYYPFQLIELVHYYYSWQVAYKQAKAEGKLKYPVDLDNIRKESKIFRLSPFDL